MQQWVHTVALRALETAPEKLIWPFAKRYVAGSNLQEALPAIQQLKEAGFLTTVDLLGESETDPDRITQNAEQYRQVLEQLRDMDGNISLKLSQFGLQSQPQLCQKLVEQLVQQAADMHQFVRLDMEDHTCTDATLTLYRQLRKQHHNVGVVLQARLRRTPDDAAALMAEGIAHIRLCKGIYLEPADMAHTEPDAIRQAFIDVMNSLLQGNTEKLAIATHDPQVVTAAFDQLSTLTHIPAVEFQMLLGVAEELRTSIQRYPVRIYVPFGEQWKAYCLRRFRENPQLLGHVINNVFSR